jgi:protein-disulfide isomerase
VRGILPETGQERNAAVQDALRGEGKMTAGEELKVAILPTDHIRGAGHAKVTIVEYGDFECPMCRAAEPALRLMLEKWSFDLRLVYRHLPIETAHPHALMAAEAAEAAGAQGRFWEMHDRLMAPHASLTRSALDGYAADLELDLPTFRAALDDEAYRQRVREHVAGAERSHVRGSPAFFVSGRICDTSGGMEHLESRIAQLLAEGRA